ncbi:MAG: hypothetical protein M3N43_06995 [Actinomycetota bacterium]|nr:hypothetical protein [Actinomycetota bacterium]
MTRITRMFSRRAGLLAMILIGLVASSAQAQMCGGGPTMAQAGPAEPSPGQPSMMGRGMMGQGMCARCMMPATAAMRGGSMEPMGMMGLSGDGPTDPKARGQWLQLRGEMLKAMGEVMLKHSQALQQTP